MSPYDRGGLTGESCRRDLVICDVPQDPRHIERFDDFRQRVEFRTGRRSGSGAELELADQGPFEFRHQRRTRDHVDVAGENGFKYLPRNPTEQDRRHDDIVSRRTRTLAAPPPSLLRDCPIDVGLSPTLFSSHGLSVGEDLIPPLTAYQVLANGLPEQLDAGSKPPSEPFKAAAEVQSCHPEAGSSATGSAVTPYAVSR